MNICVLLVSLISFSVMAEVKNVTLKGNVILNVSCPAGTTLEVKDFTAQCSCPEGTFTNRLDKEIRCESLCIITDAREEFVEQETYCDQGGCSPQVLSTHRAVVVKKNGRKIYAERIYSPRASEFDMLLKEAKAIAAKSCFKTSYRGQYL